MKVSLRHIFCAVSCSLLLSVCVTAQEYLPKWEKGYFDICTIATGLGENALLIFPDGTTMVIDCGDMSGYKWNGVAVPDASKTPAQWVARFIEHFTGRKDADYFLLSHFHSDHMGRIYSAKTQKNGYDLCGVSELAEYIRFGKMIDRDYPFFSFPKDMRGDKSQGGDARSTVNYIKFIEHQVASGLTSAEKFVVGSRKQVKLEKDSKAYDFEVWNVAGNGLVSTGKGTKTRKMYSYAHPEEFDENMFSLAQVFRYGKFKYFQGGDLGGGRWNLDWKVPGKGKYPRDFESQVADAIGGPVHVMKANHHGCPDTSNPHFLWTLRPNAVIFSCSNASHPYKTSVVRMLDPLMPGCKLLYQTQETSREQMGEALFSRLQPAGHIVVRVYPGGDKYQIFVLDSRSTDYRIIKKSKVFEL